MSFSDQSTPNNDDGYLSDLSDVSDISDPYDYTTDHDDEPSFPKDPYEQFDIEFISRKTKSRAPITTRGYQRGRRNGAHYYRRNCRKSQRVNTKAISVARGDKYELSEDETEIKLQEQYEKEYIELQEQYEKEYIELLEQYENEGTPEFGPYGLRQIEYVESLIFFGIINKEGYLNEIGLALDKHYNEEMGWDHEDLRR